MLNARLASALSLSNFLGQIRFFSQAYTGIPASVRADARIRVHLVGVTHGRAHARIHKEHSQSALARTHAYEATRTSTRTHPWTLARTSARTCAHPLTFTDTHPHLISLTRTYAFPRAITSAHARS
eukprot:6177886-Pleurochrysis_carterae.AAC.3